MGPPHERWREPVTVFRHGHPRNAEMRTQIVHKAPKWTFGTKRSDSPRENFPGPHFPADVHRDNFGKYTRDPAWTFPGPCGSPSWDRPLSAPPGGIYVPLKPSTPSWGFGTSRRDPPRADTPGPGPGAYVLKTPRGVKVSITPRNIELPKPELPGPTSYTPRGGTPRKWGHWGHAC